ncbi:MAG: DUF308 domain-containing protein [Phycisphaerales bacterium]|jgi:uncharacterized membrane protein HdeD (DUF308 family)|nr:DUF308 domain-containing protein [Phycisphaerales bacterium]
MPDTPAAARREERTPTSNLTSNSWKNMLDGVLLILLGVVLLIPSQELDTWIIRGFGLLLCAAAFGVGARLWIVSESRAFGPMVWLASIAPMVVGIVLLIWPKESASAIVVTIGIIVLVRGVVETAIGLAARPKPGWTLWLARGLFTIGLGIFFLWLKDWAAYLLLILLGIDFIARGATTLSTRSAPPRS